MLMVARERLSRGQSISETEDKWKNRILFIYLFNINPFKIKFYAQYGGNNLSHCFFIIIIFRTGKTAHRTV